MSRRMALFLAMLAVVPPAPAEIVIKLRESFINDNMHRVTLKPTVFTVTAVHSAPNPPSKDGDLHIAGLSDDVQLPMVAEMMNARTRLDLVKLLNARVGQPVRMTGVWRLWCEHAGTSTHVQGKKVALEAGDTNPDHVFELHPLTEVEGQRIEPTLAKITGFTAKDAERAFDRYENVRSRITFSPTTKTVTIRTAGVGFNYVDFTMRLEESPKTLADGTMVMASILDNDPDHPELLARGRRMMFVKDSEPEKKVRPLKKGARLRVLGIPRINLARVAFRVKNASTNPAALNDTLPYEIVIVALMP